MFFGAKSENRKGAINMMKSAKGCIFTLGGWSLFIFLSALLDANSLGSLVRVFPNKFYSSQVEVLNAKNQGSKYKSVDLDLKSQADGEIYYLTLSKKIFDYPEIKSGDKMTLEGIQNIFGVYIEEFEMEP